MTRPAELLDGLQYLPARPDGSAYPIALIGCGFISEAQLAAYAAQGFRVDLLCDRTAAKAEARRDAFFPAARVVADPREVFDDPGIVIVDLATHVAGRPALVRSALRAGKHVLSQKPFVSRMSDGQDLIDEAERAGRLLAVNHNGRWAPHFAAALAILAAGGVGQVTSADFDVYWPHDRIFRDDPHFSTMEDLILYDFGIHWFDMVATVMAAAGPARRVYASTGRRVDAQIAVPTEADVVIEYELARASLRFRGSSPVSEVGRFRIEGTAGVITHEGMSLGGPTITLATPSEAATLDLTGDWWGQGMAGTMAELIDAVATGRVPRNAAETSLPGLRICLAALRSARTGVPVDPAGIEE